MITTGVYWVNYSGNSTNGNILHVVNPAELTQMMNDQEDMTIVDLREPKLFEEGRVPNAINIPFAEIKTRYMDIPRDKKVVFVCHTGRMGTESGSLLLEKGYQNVYNLNGGMANWNGQIEK
ncbi:rhodanese-like domain-containing protein [Brevibacillus panacihumi]|uniref:rhodanese-like domain-containing protein n=1 Tax=Brevibacillus panacihumi TaxID=497735 RepID=UPI003D08A10E